MPRPPRLGERKTIPGTAVARETIGYQEAIGRVEFWACDDRRRRMSFEKGPLVEEKATERVRPWFSGQRVCAIGLVALVLAAGIELTRDPLTDTKALFLLLLGAGLFHERDERLIAGLAAHAAIAVDNAHLYREARDARAAAEAARAVDTIIRSATAQNQIIDERLDVSRIITGKLRLDLWPVDIAAVVKAAIGTVTPAASAKGIRLQLIHNPAGSYVIEMPGPDGYQLIKELRLRPSQQGGSVPAAALTASARTEDRLRALRAGFQLHLAKPVHPSELVTVVGSLAGRRQE